MLSCLRHNIISRKTHSWVYLQHSSRSHFTFSDSKVQGTLTRCRREFIHNTRQPTAQEQVSNMSGLLSSALTEGTQRICLNKRKPEITSTRVGGFFDNCMGPQAPCCHHFLPVFSFMFHIFLFANWLTCILR